MAPCDISPAGGDKVQFTHPISLTPTKKNKCSLALDLLTGGGGSCFLQMQWVPAGVMGAIWCTCNLHVCPTAPIANEALVAILEKNAAKQIGDCLIIFILSLWN